MLAIDSSIIIVLIFLLVITIIGIILGIFGIVKKSKTFGFIGLGLVLLGLVSLIIWIARTLIVLNSY